MTLNIERSPVLNTKWGIAKINNYGYYRIVSSKEGNYKKLLHRLIFEDFYSKIPRGYVVHHKDFNKTNNCIMNLQILTKPQHNIIHKKGKKHSLESRNKMSESKIGKKNNMYGKKHSDETRKKMREARKGKCTGDKNGRWKDYARVIKQGFNRQGKQNYVLKYEGKIIRQSINKDKLQELAKEINRGCLNGF